MPEDSSAKRSVQLLTSSSLIRLEERLLEEIRTEKSADPHKPVVVLCASNLLGRYLSRRLASTGQPHLGISFLTFTGLARILTRREMLERELLPLPTGGKTLLAGKRVRQLSEDSYFSRVRDRPHLPTVLEATFTDIEDSRLDIGSLAKEIPWESESSQRKVSEVADLYNQYRGDVENRFFAAADLLGLAAQSAGTFEELLGTRRLFVYGFYETTGAQLELLDRLTHQADVCALLFSSPEERHSFSRPFYEWWRERAGDEVILESGQPSSDLEALRRHVFNRTRQKREDDGSVRTFSCLNETQEVREIAREAVRLRKEQGIEFTEMAVLVRDVDKYNPLLCETFDRVGLPYYVRDGLLLARTSAGKATVSLLRLLKGGFGRKEVAEWLTQGGVRKAALSRDGSPAPVALWDRLSMDAGIVGGQREWFERLKGLRDSLNKEQGKDTERHKKRQALAARVGELLAFVQSFFPRLADLSKKTGWAELVEGSLALIREYHIPTRDRDEVETLVGSLRSLDMLGEATDYRTFLALVERRLQETSREIGELQKTGIHVLSLSAARYLRFRVVFLPGMTEKSFPLAGRQDPILLDEERELLTARSTGAGLPVKRARPMEERLLFLLAAESAQEFLRLSFPRTDAINGSERVPSYYLLEAHSCLRDSSLTFATLEQKTPVDSRIHFIGTGRLLNLPDEECIDAREFDLNTVARCQSKSEIVSAAYLGKLCPTVPWALESEKALWKTRELTPFDGYLVSAAARELLSQRFGPDRVYSPTRLERYAACPYHFFLQDVLGLEALEEPEAVEKLDALERGTLVHDILHKFFTVIKDEGKFPLSRGDWEIYFEKLSTICERSFSETETRGLTGYPLMWKLTKRAIRQDLERLLLLEIDRSGEWLPERFEQEFGFEGSPYELSVGQEVVKLRGIIDRIDRSPDGKNLRVIDYKTGKWTGKYRADAHFDGGASLQLPIYLGAAGKLFPESEAETSHAEYLMVAREGQWKQSVFRGSKLSEDHQQFEFIVGQILRGLREGLFPRYPENKSYPKCEDCDFCTVGDSRHAKLWERKKDTAHLEGFLEMKKMK